MAIASVRGCPEVVKVCGLRLAHDWLHFVVHPGLIIFTNTAQPGPRQAEAVRLLGSSATTRPQSDARVNDIA